MTDKSSIILSVDNKLKKEFYKLTAANNMSAMRTMIILMERFTNGLIDTLPIIQDYQAFRTDEIDKKTKMLLKHRIHGGTAFQINKQKKGESNG